MTEVQHTPGPWTCRGRDGVISGYIEGDGKTIAKVGDYDTGKSWEADARLIAAAPELLEAATLLVQAMDDSLDSAFWKEDLRAAIAKATT